MIDPTDLIWAGLTPPKPGSYKTTCPIYSHARSKPWKRCVSVYDDGARCWHCGMEWVFGGAA